MIAFLLALAAALQAAPPPASPALVPPVATALEPVVGDWIAIPDDQLLVMTLAGDRTVIIRLASGYAPEHVANVRALALAHWWDGTSVYRVQDNWVTQWGDQSEKKPLAAGVAARPAAEYDLTPFTAGGPRLAQAMVRSDAYSVASGITSDGWATASDGRTAWLTHCYGTVGVARDASPDTGSGAELFTAIGGSAAAARSQLYDSGPGDRGNGLSVGPATQRRGDGNVRDRVRTAADRLCSAGERPCPPRHGRITSTARPTISASAR